MIITVVGARPQFIKASPVSCALRAAGMKEVLVHTGQHYDEGMSDIFFQELGIPAPKYHLGMGGGNHGAMTGGMLQKIEEILLEEKPEAVLVYGDTNSTLAGALAAAKLQIPVAHVEAGLRSFNKSMPEELNRICTDHLATWLYCSSEHGAELLRREGITTGIEVVGDVMADVFYQTRQNVEADPDLLATVRALAGGGPFDLLTIHRADTTSHPAIVGEIVSTIAQTSRTILFPVHPRTKKVLLEALPQWPANVRLLEPVGYRQMVALLLTCERVLTDSGGLQKEAYWAGKPCITLRNETEWVETVEAGWNRLAGTRPETIRPALANFTNEQARPVLYGDGRASQKIASHLTKCLSDG